MGKIFRGPLFHGVILPQDSFEENVRIVFRKLLVNLRSGDCTSKDGAAVALRSLIVSPWMDEGLLGTFLMDMVIAAVEAVHHVTKDTGVWVFISRMAVHELTCAVFALQDCQHC